MDFRKEFFVIDRIERVDGDDSKSYAVLEDESGLSLRVGVDALPPGAKEGDALVRDGGGFAMNPELTALRRSAAAKALRDALAQRPRE